jgi:pSer/pThr/pTyr-binding forkhead associated (FHA) protein
VAEGAVRLQCTAGPLTGETITVDAELLVGRELPGPGNLGKDPRLSRRHARIFIEKSGSAVIEDLGSTNGTWINDERLAEPRTLADRDKLRLGQSCFTIELSRPRPAIQAGPEAPLGARTLADEPSSAPCLRVVSGPSTGLDITLGDEFLVGRSYGEPGALGGDKSLSRRHARITRGEGGVFFITDTGSTNGTVLNHQLLRGSQALSDGDEIKVGSSTLIAEHLPAAPLTPELEEPPAEAEPAPPAYAPQGAAAPRFSSRRVIAVFAVVFFAAAFVALGAVLINAPLQTSACPSGFVCHKPPTAPPLQAEITFTGSLGWRAEYDPQLTVPVTADVRGNQLVLQDTRQAARENLGVTSGRAGLGIWIRGYPASQFTAQAAMQDMLNALSAHLVGAVTAPSSDQMFGVPVLGFHTATGEVIDGAISTPQGPGALEKVAVRAATSGSVTIAAAVFYPIRRSSVPNTNPDEPIDQFADSLLETVRFPSDGSL